VWRLFRQDNADAAVGHADASGNLWFGLALITALSKADEPGHNVYFAGILLVVFAGHVFLNLRSSTAR